jgi:uncharacterized damage-inducible protein DinB
MCENATWCCGQCLAALRAEQDARIAELEAAQARQMTTIETLTAQLNEACKACEMWANRPVLEQVEAWGTEWAREITREDFFDWLIRRAREEEEKAP